MSHTETADPVDTAFDDVRADVVAKVLRRARTAKSHYLHATTQGRYMPVRSGYWTSGFWPGLLRLALNEVEDYTCQTSAKQAEDGLFDILDTPEFFELHHDVGFQFLPTAVMRHRQTGCEDARRRGIVAANLLAGRFNVASGMIEAWNGEARGGYSIIDTLMNLPLLFWASETTGVPRFANMAKVHLSRAIADFVRDDMTTHHIIQYDQNSGEKVAAHGGQGKAPDSAWSRGHAWEIYGLAIAARYTGQADYADLSRKLADRFLELNAPHGVPPWDFRDDDPASAPRDSSAAAITACGLLELGDMTGETEAVKQASDLIEILTDRVCCLDDSQDGILLEATSALPSGVHISDSLIYGDYFYLEALQRLSGVGRPCW